MILKDLISEIYCLYLELKECKRYGENGTYSRIAKDYQMLQILKESADGKNNNNVILATYTPIERTILKTDIEKRIRIKFFMNMLSLVVKNNALQT